MNYDNTNNFLGDLGEALQIFICGRKGHYVSTENLIRRTNVPSDPQNNMNAADDYFRLMVHAHVVAAAKTVMKFNPQTSVKDHARLIITNYIRFPETDSTKDDKPITTGDDNTWSSLAWVP